MSKLDTPYGQHHTKAWLTLSQRLLLITIGGYFFSAALATWGALLLSRLIPRSEAVVLMTMLGFVIYLLTLMWGFAQLRLWQLWLVLAGVPVIAFFGLLTFLEISKTSVG